MTKDEAINAMKAGRQVRHQSFSADEWVTMAGSREMLIQDGSYIDAKMYWIYLSDPKYESDWEVIKIWIPIRAEQQSV